MESMHSLTGIEGLVYIFIWLVYIFLLYVQLCVCPTGNNHMELCKINTLLYQGQCDATVGVFTFHIKINHCISISL